MRSLVAALLALTVFAGCITPPEDPDRASFDLPAPPPEEDRVEGMTFTEEKQDTVTRCDDGVLSVAAYCAERTLVVTGRMGVERLPVELLGNNGGVGVNANGVGDAWSFQVVLKTRGLTEDEARKALDTEWSWSHEGPDGHHLKAGPTRELGLVQMGLASVVYNVALPAWVKVDLRAQTTNGAMVLNLQEAESVTAHTTNGAVALAAHAREVDVRTTNGAVTAQVTPTETGSLRLATTNGAITLIVPEDRDHGHDVDARATNGRVGIHLRDGKVVEEDRGHATFRTDGYDAREIRTEVRVETTNGAVTIG